MSGTPGTSTDVLARPRPRRGWRAAVRVVAAGVLAALGVAGAPAVASAQEVEVPVHIQVPLFMKVMSFDRQFLVRAGTEVVVGVAFQGGYAASVTARDEVVRALRGMVVGPDGRGVRAVPIDLDRVSAEDALARVRPCVLYVAPLRGADVAALAAAARRARVTTVTGVPRYVSLGLAVGARLQGDRPRLLINVEASRQEGAAFAAELLKLAQVVP